MDTLRRTYYTHRYQFHTAGCKTQWAMCEIHLCDRVLDYVQYLIWDSMVTWRGDAGECRSTVFATISMNGGHNQTYTEFRRCVDEFWRISVKYLKSEVRSWDSDVRRKIGQKYHSCGAKVTCAASKVTCAAQISSVRQHFYHWNSEKYNMYMRIINVQTGTHNGHPYCTES